MINIVFENTTVAKFESFDSGKAFDWITQKGWYIEHKSYHDGNTTWECQPL